MSNIPKKIIAFGNKTGARDKLCRFLQYSFRALSDILDRLDTLQYAPLIKRFKKLDSSISTARKLLRLGKGFEMLYAAKEGFYIKDFVIQTCVVLSRIASACFLFLDHILWLHRVKAINVDIKPISKLCNQFWVLSTIINLIRNAYDWNRIRLNQHSKHEDLPAGYVPELLPTALDTVKNSFDLLIPMNGLKYWNIAGVVQGTTGAISSVIGMMTIWDDRLKLQNR